MSKVVVTGMGIVSPIGQNMAEFEASLRAGSSGIASFAQDSPGAIAVGAKLENFNFEERLKGLKSFPPDLLKEARKCARRAPFSVQASTLSALQAWEQGQFFEKGGTPMSLVVGGHNISQRYQYELSQKFEERSEYLPPSYALHFMDNNHVGVLSEVFKIQGEGFTAGGASASGNLAIIQGMRLIRYGLAETCMVVGALTDLSPMEMQAFYGIRAMGGKRFRDQPAKACRPFDRDCEGFIYGQASGCLMLESESSARKRGARVWGEIAGVALCLDGNRLPHPDEAGEVRVMQKALEDAGVTSSQVDYVNAHGTSSGIGDATEIAAIKTVFKESLKRVWINSTKSMTGHSLYAAGVVEAIATLLQMNAGFVHPNLNLENPIDRECRLVGQKSEEAAITVALSNSFAFGGINTAIILKAVP